jgi:hypothetical protein
MTAVKHGNTESLPISPSFSLSFFKRRAYHVSIFIKKRRVAQVKLEKVQQRATESNRKENTSRTQYAYQ